MRSSIGALHERPGLPKKKRRLTELFDGWQLRTSVGDLAKTFRLIDNPNNRYAEHVEAESGEICAIKNAHSNDTAMAQVFSSTTHLPRN
jgi:hypothetical protein